MTLTAGTRLGPYEILGPLGAGGMGEVYRGRDTKLGREVAVKVLPEELASDPDRLARFEREARLLASLHHPYILSIHDFGSERGTSYAATELLEGETLRARLTKSPLPVSKTVEYGKQIAQGLSAAHAKGVVHRDLKPENLFITKDGGIKILDFGLARRSYPAATQGGDDLPTLAADSSLGELRTAEGVVLGTVGYMSPEQVRGETADARSDIFSFGAVTYEMLTGERAFRRDSALETLAAIAHDDPPEMQASGRPVPAPLEHVVHRCLEKSPDDRFQTARDLAFALEEAGQASDASTTFAPSRSNSFNRSKLALLTLSAVVVIAAIIAAIVWLRPSSAKETKRPAGTAPASVVTSSAPSGAQAVPTKSIAVLPFANESGNPKERYFSDGLSEDLIIALNQYPKLKVIGRDSSFQLRDSHLGSKAIGEKLGVAHLLEGSVSRAGDEVRIRAELVNAADGSTLWSHHYDRPYKDLFALQDEITKAVASALEAKLLAPQKSTAVAQSDRPPSGDLKAYNAYLEGNFYFNRLDQKSFRKAISYYQNAVTVDPAYDAAYAALSSAWAHLAAGFLSGDAKQEAFLAAQKAATSALDIDADSANAHRVLGSLYLYELQFNKAWTELHRAFKLAPNDMRVERDLARGLVTRGQVHAAIPYMVAALKANPLDALDHYYLSRYLLFAGELTKAKQEVLRAIELQPTGFDFDAQLAFTDLAMGDSSAAVAAARKASDPGIRAWAEAITYTAAGNHQLADAALRKLVSTQAARMAYQVAETYAFRKQPGKTFSWLDRAWRQRDGGISELLFDPFMRPYWHDPRFAAFCRKVGLPVPGATAGRTPS